LSRATVGNSVIDDDLRLELNKIALPGVNAPNGAGIGPRIAKAAATRFVRIAAALKRKARSVPWLIGTIRRLRGTKSR
jgi:hypothetical protein